MTGLQVVWCDLRHHIGLRKGEGQGLTEGVKHSWCRGHGPHPTLCNTPLHPRPLTLCPFNRERAGISPSESSCSVLARSRGGARGVVCTHAKTEGGLWRRGKGSGQTWCELGEWFLWKNASHIPAAMWAYKFERGNELSVKHCGLLDPNNESLRTVASYPSVFRLNLWGCKFCHHLSRLLVKISVIPRHGFKFLSC